MSGLTGRIRVNLLVIVLGIFGITSIAFLTYAGGVAFQDTYLITVPLPEAGGALPGQQVTVLGKPVGQIKDVELTAQGVLYTLEIDGEQSVPARAEVKVLRRSPIGEQAVEFRPLDAPWTPAPKDSRVLPVSTITPSSIPALLDEATQLFDAIEERDVGIIVSELADGLRGRGQLLVDLNRELLETNTTLVAGIPEFERLLATSDPVLTLLNDQSNNILAFARNSADLMEVLEDNQPNLERMLVTAPLALNQTEGLIINQRANLQCIGNDLVDLNAMLNGPSTATGFPATKYNTKLDELQEAFRASPFFWQAFDVGGQFDPTNGSQWVRVLLKLQAGGGVVYANPREVPAIKPGAACSTEQWGTGINAVRQAAPAPPLPGGVYDYAPLIAGAGPKPVGAPARSGGVSSGGGSLPATGGGLVAIGLLLGGASLHARRRK